MVIREWTLPNAEARPRRLAIDANDVIWYPTTRAGIWAASIRQRAT